MVSSSSLMANSFGLVINAKKNKAKSLLDLYSAIKDHKVQHKESYDKATKRPQKGPSRPYLALAMAVKCNKTFQGLIKPFKATQGCTSIGEWNRKHERTKTICLRVEVFENLHKLE